ncbi:MAG: BCCT family transporter [Eubacteriales bacterium]|nr:BCCT family transporter [Eubacteriales bacterium]
MEHMSNKVKLYKPVLIVIVAALLIEIIVGIFFTEQFGAAMSNMLYWVGDHFGWWINLLAVFCVIAGIVIVIFRWGDVKIGGKDAKPDFSYWQWFSMSICSGIGCGLMFWAMGEPMYHFMTPPAAIQAAAGSREAAIFAVSQAMFDWSFVQYFIYSLPALAFALLCFNYQKSLSMGPMLDLTAGEKTKKLTTFMHIICGYAVACGVSNSMAAGLMQISGGINAVFGIPQGALMYLIITVLVAVFFIFSCVTGINKGLTYVSSACMVCFFVLMIYMVIAGDTMFIGKIGSEATGDLLNNFWSKITINNTMVSQDQWANEWPITFWNSFFIYAPVIGMFLARMGKGRTVREFLLVEILVPSLFCCLFVAIFAGQIVSVQTSGAADVWAMIQEEGMQTTLYQVLGSMPFGKIVQFAFLITVCLSFITLADPNCAALSTLCVHGQEIDSEPPKPLKIGLGIAISAVAYLLVISGGVNAVKGLLNLGGLLMTIPTLWLILMNFKLIKPLLKSKSHLASDIPTEDEISAPDQHRKAVAKGLTVIVEKDDSNQAS